jgi:SAM-dependent methyltransferase
MVGATAAPAYRPRAQTAFDSWSRARLLAVSDLPEYVARNRASWDEWAHRYEAAGRRNWAAAEPSWGIWNAPESQVRMLPEDLEFPLLHGNAEKVPYPDGSFDFALSEYGASIWADPYRWIPEAARLLRPGGRLAFLVNAPLLVLCMHEHEGEAADERLKRPYFGLHRVEWPDDDSVAFHLPHGEMIALLLDSGFEVEALTEIRPPEDATTTYDFVTREWAEQWPSEEVWRARKRG